MHHVLRCWERQSDGSEYKKPHRRSGLCPGLRSGSLRRSLKPPSWWEGLQEPHPQLVPTPLMMRSVWRLSVWRLSDVCLMMRIWRLSVAYIGHKSRTERPRKAKTGTEVAHVTRDSDTTFKVKVTRPLYSPPCWRVRQLQRWVWVRVGREKLLRSRHVARPHEARFGAHGGGEGRGHIVAATRLQLV